MSEIDPNLVSLAMTEFGEWIDNTVEPILGEAIRRGYSREEAMTLYKVFWSFAYTPTVKVQMAMPPGMFGGAQ